MRKLAPGDLSAELATVVVRHSLFASHPFMDVWKALSGHVVFWVAEEEGNIAAVLAGVEFGRKPLARFQSLPDGIPSVFACQGITHDRVHLASQILDGLSQHGYIKTFVTDFDNSFPPHSTFHRAEMVTHVVDISNPSYEPSDKTLMSEIRKAEREHTSVVPFNWSKHGGRFIDLVAISETRHGRLPKYPSPFFERLAVVAEHDDRIIWMWCEHEGRAVASHIYFIQGDNAINWQIYYDKDFPFLKANQLTTWRTIADLRARGVTRLNLGASPDEAEGLVAYKSKWNAVEHSYSILEKKSWLGKLW
ncbi:MAG: GNAT family N-acetyltransferase [Candidatus Zixiibacteriota bacterium]